MKICIFACFRMCVREYRHAWICICVTVNQSFLFYFFLSKFFQLPQICPSSLSSHVQIKVLQLILLFLNLKWEGLMSYLSMRSHVYIIKIYFTYMTKKWRTSYALGSNYLSLKLYCYDIDSTLITTYKILLPADLELQKEQQLAKMLAALHFTLQTRTHHTKVYFLRLSHKFILQFYTSFRNL